MCIRKLRYRWIPSRTEITSLPFQKCRVFLSDAKDLIMTRSFASLRMTERIIKKCNERIMGSNPLSRHCRFAFGNLPLEWPIEKVDAAVAA